jgi:ABC-2 type transport system permease protein
MEDINWYGTYSLTLREVKRFLRVYHQTLITPAVSALIFLAVFALAVGARKHEINGIKFINFMGYGLTPPLGSKEIIIAFTLGAVLRGLMVGIIVTISLMPFVEFTLYYPLLLAFYTLASCMLLGKLGILSGMIANSFDQHSAITSYLITPLSFLSGTFYSVKDLPQILQQINLLNPFFYMIDGFRYCLTNKADGNIILGIVFLITSNIVMYLVLEKLIDKGWRIKG